MAEAPIELRIGVLVEQAKRQLRIAVGQLRSRVVAAWEAALLRGLPVRAAQTLAVAELSAIQQERWRPMFEALDATYNEAVAQGWTEGLVQRTIDTQGSAERLEWQTISSRPCPDCDGRNGQTEDVATWRRIGMPGTRWPGGGAPVCSLQVIRCKCKLVPAGNGAGRILMRTSDEERPGRTRAA